MPSGATTQWNYSDGTHPYYPTTITDAQGNQVTTHYTAAGNPDTVTDQLPSQNQTQVFYNGNGTVDHVLDARGNRTSYVYDPVGNLTQITPPAPLGQTVITPDGLSRPHMVKDGKQQQTTATFDNLDRVTNTLYADGSTIISTPDADGNLTSMVDSTGTTSFQYDARNRKTQKTLPGTRTISYGYDLASNLTVFTDAGGQVGYHYNAVDLVDTLTEPNGLGQTTFGYDPNHRRTSTTFPGGVVQTQSYDNSERLASIGATAPGGAALTSYAYNYQRNGTGPDTALVTVITDPVNGRTVANTYDVLNRLTEWKVTPTGGLGATAHDYLYQYDGVGNRTQISADGTVTALGYNAANEWLTATSGGKTATYSYDANGNELGNDGFGDPSKALAITYNAKNQTATVTDTKQNVIPMGYTGARQAEQVSAGWVASNPDTRGGPASDTYGSGLVNQTDNAGTTYYTRDPSGTLISQRLPNGTVYHYLFDGEGSVVQVVDGAGNAVARYFYCPTGNGADPPTGSDVGQPWQHWGLYYEQGDKTYRLGDLRFDPNSGNASTPFCLLFGGFFSFLCPRTLPITTQQQAQTYPNCPSSSPRAPANQNLGDLSVVVRGPERGPENKCHVNAEITQGTSSLLNWHIYYNSNAYWAVLTGESLGNVPFPVTLGANPYTAAQIVTDDIAVWLNVQDPTYVLDWGGVYWPLVYRLQDLTSYAPVK